MGIKRLVRPRRLQVMVVVGGLALVALAAPAHAVMAALPPTPVQPAPPSDLFVRPVHGTAALKALDGNRAQVAARNHRTVAELSALLRDDHAMWLDQTGRLFVKDNAPTVSAPAGPPAAGPYPNDQTFQLHSLPGAQRVLYLDFDGQAVSGTAWNSNYALSTDVQPGFDLNGDPQVWSQAEVDVVQSVFERVSEDYAPFAIDVTTEDPGDDALYRTASSDQSYGARVLITPSSEAHDKLCGSCGGIAYVAVFDMVGSAGYQPAWVFSNALQNNAKYIAEAASHEAGHNLGLVHDGTSTASYYTGHRNWAPIMGVGYYEPVVQWSSGEYPDANNTEDDFAVMQSYGLPLRADDHGSTVGTADLLGTATSASGLIGTRSDRDVFAISRTCSESTTITLAVGSTSPDLDAALHVLDASGSQLAINDPSSGSLSADVATGLSAAITANLPAGDYYLEVDGVGVLDTATGYSDYGSLGRYSLSISACSTVTTVPTTPLSLTVSKDDGARTATIDWEQPASDGGSPITGYLVERDGGSTGGKAPWSKIVGPVERSQTFLNLAQGATYTLSVAAINAVGTGPAASGLVTLAAPVTNLLKNPGFELDANADSRPDHWTATSAFTRSSARVFSGRHAGRFRATGHVRRTTAQRVAPVVPGVGYRFSGRVFIPTARHSMTFWIQVRWRNSANRVVRTDVLRRYKTTTKGWSRARALLNSPPGATRAQIQLVAVSVKSTAYVDDFMFRRR